MKVKFKVRDDLAFWACSAGKFEPGEECELDTDENSVREIIAAEAAGSIYGLTDVDGTIGPALLDVVESQTDSEARLAEAMADVVDPETGLTRWGEGHLQQFALDAEFAEIEVGSDN
jgi:hypothetical protein